MYLYSLDIHDDVHLSHQNSLNSKNQIYKNKPLFGSNCQKYCVLILILTSKRFKRKLNFVFGKTHFEYCEKMLLNMK